MKIIKMNSNSQLDSMIDDWQKKICDTIYYSLSLLGLIAYIPSFILSIRDNLPLIAIIDTLAYIIILFITFYRRISYTLKAILGSIVFYFLGIILFITLGPIGAGNLWLLGFSLITALTLGEKAAIISFIINLITQVIYYLFIKYNIFLVELTIVMDADIWLIRAVNFIVINLVIVISTSILTKKLSQTFSIQNESENLSKESELRMRAIFDQSPLGMAFVNPSNDMILDANRSWNKLLHIDKNEKLEKDWISLVHPDERLILKKKLVDLKSGKTDLINTENRLICRDQAILRIELNIINIKAGENLLQGYLAMFRDITNEKEMEEHQKTLQNQLNQNQKMEAVGQLAGGVAHDFNNQLTGVLGYAEILVDSIEDPILKQYAENICTAAIRSSDLTKKLLAYSRQANFRSIPVNIHNLIIETAGILNHTIDKKISIQLNLNANFDEVMGDPSLLQNAFLNLAINARDAMPNGGLLKFCTSNIKIKHNENQLIDEGNYMQIIIDDTGHGIPQEIKNQVFDPFFTTKDFGKGTGMGLAAVYGTIKQHNGVIYFDSNLDGGTSFYIYIPQHEIPEMEKELA